MNQTRQRRPTAPKPVRQVARAARLSLREVAWAVLSGQPSPSTPRDHTALMRWLRLSVVNANPGIAAGELAEQVVARLEDGRDRRRDRPRR